MSKRWFNANNGYFQLPRALMYDNRLKHPDIRVFIAIASYVMLKDDVYPSRKSLQQLTGIQVSNISRRTGRLVEFGWLSKFGRQGRRTTYSLKVPEYALNRMEEVMFERAALRAKSGGKFGAATASIKPLINDLGPGGFGVNGDLFDSDGTT